MNPTNETDPMDAAASLRQYTDMKCDLCDIELIDLQHANEHYTEHGKKCGYVKCCGVRLYKPVHVTDHLLYHKHPDIFKCSECERCYLHRSLLRAHLEQHRLKEAGRFKCTVCGYIATSGHRLKEHRTMHERNIVGEFYCDQCKLKWVSSFSFLFQSSSSFISLAWKKNRSSLMEKKSQLSLMKKKNFNRPSL